MRHKTRQLAHVIFQRGYPSIHGLALGVHGVVISSALFAGRDKGLRQQIIADGHLLDFLHRFSGVVGQNLIDIDARIGKLLDVDSGRLAHVGDLLQVRRHAGQLCIAAACSRNSVAQRHDDLAGVSRVFTGADEQLVGLCQARHIKWGAGGVLLNGVHGRFGRLSAAQHVGKASGVAFQLGVIPDAGLDKILGRRQGHRAYFGDDPGKQVGFGDGPGEGAAGRLRRPTKLRHVGVGRSQGRGGLFQLSPGGSQSSFQLLGLRRGAPGLFDRFVVPLCQLGDFLRCLAVLGAQLRDGLFSAALHVLDALPVGGIIQRQSRFQIKDIQGVSPPPHSSARAFALSAVICSAVRVSSFVCSRGKCRAASPE